MEKGVPSTPPGGNTFGLDNPAGVSTVDQYRSEMLEEIRTAQAAYVTYQRADGSFWSTGFAEKGGNQNELMHHAAKGALEVINGMRRKKADGS